MCSSHRESEKGSRHLSEQVRDKASSVDWAWQWSSLKVCEKLGFGPLQHRGFSGNDRSLGGEFREDTVSILGQEL